MRVGITAETVAHMLIAMNQRKKVTGGLRQEVWLLYKVAPLIAAGPLVQRRRLKVTCTQVNDRATPPSFAFNSES
jgi:hypothetical protein